MPGIGVLIQLMVPVVARKLLEDVFGLERDEACDDDLRDEARVLFCGAENAHLAVSTLGFWVAT